MDLRVPASSDHALPGYGRTSFVNLDAEDLGAISTQFLKSASCGNQERCFTCGRLKDPVPGITHSPGCEMSSNCVRREKCAARLPRLRRIGCVGRIDEHNIRVWARPPTSSHHTGRVGSSVPDRVTRPSNRGHRPYSGTDESYDNDEHDRRKKQPEEDPASSKGPATRRLARRLGEPADAVSRVLRRAVKRHGPKLAVRSRCSTRPRCSTPPAWGSTSALSRRRVRVWK